MRTDGRTAGRMDERPYDAITFLLQIRWAADKNKIRGGEILGANK